MKEKCDKEKAVEAMYVAAGIGQVIASRAFIAGAAGRKFGCSCFFTFFEGKIDTILITKTTNSKAEKR